MNFAENLKSYRKAENLSGKDLAIRLGIPYTTYMGYENQGKQPKLDILIKLAKIFNTSVDRLIGFDYDVDNYPEYEKLVREAGFYVENTEINGTDSVVVMYKNLYAVYEKDLFSTIIGELKHEILSFNETIIRKLFTDAIRREFLPDMFDDNGDPIYLPHDPEEESDESDVEKDTD